MAYVHASPFNAFVPAATGQIISYTRDPAKYKINEYAQLFKSDAAVGVYYKLNPDDSARVVSLDEDVWADGHSRKDGDTVGQRFDLVEFQTIRRNKKAKIGWQALKAGNRNSLNLLVANTNIVRNLTMIARTARLMALLETANSATWGSNFGSATTLGGGVWTSGTDSDPVIKRTLMTIAKNIHLATNGMVSDLDNEEDVGLNLILSPDDAALLSTVPEIHSYLARSQFALDQIKGKNRGQNALWGLPDFLYGYKLVVENAVRVKEREAADGTVLATANRGWVKTNNSAVITSRPGGLDGQMGAPSFSTAQIYFVDKEISLDTFDDPEDELTRVHVQENVKEVVAAPAAGYLITGLFS